MKTEGLGGGAEAVESRVFVNKLVKITSKIRKWIKRNPLKTPSRVFEHSL